MHTSSRPWVGRANIDIDDALVARVMRLYHLPIRGAPVDYALRQVAVPPLATDEILAMRRAG